MTESAWIDGHIRPSGRPAVAPTDPGVLYGLGVFEVVHAYGGVPFRLDDHLSRMARSARAFGLAWRVSTRTIDSAIRDLCRRNHTPEAYVRITLTGGGRLFILTRPPEPIPPSWRTRGASVALASWRRDPTSPLFGHKTLNYLENVWAHRQGLAKGMADTLLVSTGGDLLEGCVSNIFLARHGTLFTPSATQHILPGVTRKVVLELARRLRIPVIQRRVPVKELRQADETFITGTMKEILPVVKAGPWRIGSGQPGALTRALANAYRTLVTGGP